MTFSTIGFFEIEEGRKSWSFPKGGLKKNFAAKLLADSLRNVEAKTHSFRVEFLGSVKEAEKFEQFFFIFIFNSNSWILNFDFNHTLALGVQKVWNMFLVVEAVNRVNECAFDGYKPSA